MFGKKKSEEDVPSKMEYVGNIRKKPVIEQKFMDNENYAFNYVETQDLGMLRIYPYVVLTDDNSMFLMSYITNGTKEITHIKFRIGTERRTVFTKRIRYDIRAESYTAYILSKNFDNDLHKHERGYLEKVDIEYLKKMAYEKKAYVEFHGDEIYEYKVGEFERKAILKMISELEVYENEGFVFSPAKY